MVACWQEDPLKRPSFRDIVDVSTALLEKMGGAPLGPDDSRNLVRDRACVEVATAVNSSKESMYFRTP